MDIESVYRQYFKDVFLYLRSLSADAGTAEEIAQETFMKALRSLDSFDGSRDIRAWLFTIARNTYYTFCRREHIYVDASRAEKYGESAGGCRIPGQLEERAEMPGDVIEQLADEERSFLIHRFLHGMREPYKEVFSLRVFGELPFDKIGQLFGKSSGWARVSYYRAKQMIREYMEAIEHDSAATAAAVLAVAAGVYALLTLPRSVIPYEKSGASVSRVSLGESGEEYLYCSMDTSEAAGSVCHEPVTVQTEAGEKTVVILYEYSTMWSRHVAPLFEAENEAVTLEPLGSADEIDAVYYGEFEPVSEFYEDPSSVLDKAELIWSAPAE